MKKFFTIIILLSIMGYLGWRVHEKILVLQNKVKPKPQKTGVAVEVAKIERKSISDVHSFTGSIFPKSHFILAPRISGRLVKLYFDIGDAIKQKDLIAVIDDEEYRLEVDKATCLMNVALANVEEALSDLGVAQTELARARSLRQREIVSKSDLDVAEAKYKAAEVKHKVALTQVEKEKVSLQAMQVRHSYTKIHAFWEGDSKTRVVGERFVHEGSMLAVNTPILSVLDLDTVLAVVHVIEQDYSRIEVGQKATVTTDAFPGKKFSAKTVRIAPLLKETSRQAKVEMEIINADHLLKPGMFIRAEMEFLKKDNVLSVPLSSIVKRNGKEGVFLVNMEKEKVQFVPVSLGISQDNYVEIISPDIKGFVVSLGQHLLSDDASIVLPPEDKPKAEHKKEQSMQTKVTGKI
ncbi:MAG: efflux RND transporter periplasmic adaptor subunit [Candidatus Brocadiae bacterium]|nr:efflux RND transporter periplasmic adaptor subunit [Candidatus Brocadiia bacterium]